MRSDYWTRNTKHLLESFSPAPRVFTAPGVAASFNEKTDLR